MKKVYIVNGSEDGIIGVFSSKRKARQRATNYVLSDCSTHSLDSLVFSDVYEWFEYFSSNNTTVTARIIIEELQ